MFLQIRNLKLNPELSTKNDADPTEPTVYTYIDIVWTLLDVAVRPAGAGVGRPGSRPPTATPSPAPSPSIYLA